jgi:hypothetical protein
MGGSRPWIHAGLLLFVFPRWCTTWRAGIESQDDTRVRNMSMQSRELPGRQSLACFRIVDLREAVHKDFKNSEIKHGDEAIERQLRSQKIIELHQQIQYTTSTPFGKCSAKPTFTAR